MVFMLKPLQGKREQLLFSDHCLRSAGVMDL